MTRSDLTLPGDIPGLLRRGSPVVVPQATLRGVVFKASPSGVTWVDMRPQENPCIFYWSEGGSGRDMRPALDLTDPTGRAHAAWWAMTHRTESEWPNADACVLFAACDGVDLPREDIARLRDIVLTVAGRLP